MRRLGTCALLAGLGLILSFGASATEVYPIEIEMTATSDWTDVTISGATLVVHDYELISGGHTPGLSISALSTLSVSKACCTETAVTVRFLAYLANPSESFSVTINKGHIGQTTVEILAPGATRTLASYRHAGISGSGNPANSRTFTTPFSELSSAISPVELGNPPGASFGGQLVLAFYYPWYGTPSGPSGEWVHWSPHLSHYDSAHVPAYGLYDSNDPETVRRHIREAKAAGIDGFIVSWWGRNTFEDRAFDVLAQVAQEEDFLLTIYYEIAQTTVDVVTDLTVFLTRHAGSSALLHVDGRPVVFFYVRVMHTFSLDQWQAIFDQLDALGRAVFSVADGLNTTYLDVFDGIHIYNPVNMTPQESEAQYVPASLLARAKERLFAATVLPGYDEKYRDPNRLYVDRENGETYRAYWAAARTSEPHWVLITSYNEWHEGSEIEPSTEFGSTYLDLTAEQSEAWKAGIPSIVADPDRDGDGVPDADDLCPDFPGDAAMKGC